MARTITGVVSSDRSDKTIVVTVATRKTHPIYKKQYTSSRKFMAHDEANDANIGDKVVITETRPLSRNKRFTLVKVLERAAIRHTDEPEADVDTEIVEGKKDAPDASERAVEADKEEAAK